MQIENQGCKTVKHELPSDLTQERPDATLYYNLTAIPRKYEHGIKKPKNVQCFSILFCKL